MVRFASILLASFCVSFMVAIETSPLKAIPLPNGEYVPYDPMVDGNLIFNAPEQTFDIKTTVDGCHLHVTGMTFSAPTPTETKYKYNIAIGYDKTDLEIQVKACADTPVTIDDFAKPLDYYYCVAEKMKKNAIVAHWGKAPSMFTHEDK
ncbi:hypothetical protein Pmar_PMAR012165 [Perkinsus marinus ATCC 50983]|uniref:Uncharacterized protein n=2 Tax=Perkinsus marinus (strain ATCC 50983 / TXsc) TaxID=423536 RepID=C5L2N1_PERM5|nr:hypothetical protein Pmar_PMAR012165 [Perkinsus marinus ATCC 50983]EER09012.1 hypothetical protein Pmar_PMAR012165 [Perkinsus marinus ATCC 50983]|eukprot:XP_002777196.1 hypothetical protein Pmar_PMAR012165 [Perkinsus marinus ATCC 50983]